MPLPLILVGAAIVAGVVGAGAAFTAKDDFDKAKDIDRDAREIYDRAEASLQRCRKGVQTKLETLGADKARAYGDSLKPFADTYRRIKKVDLNELKISDEALKDININAEIQEIQEIAIQISEAIAVGLSAGAGAGLAAYGTIGLGGTASTGAAISGLLGVAETNATLAWLGGGSLAASGFGMAGGTAVLGGIVAGPVLAVAGWKLASKAAAAKENARSNRAMAHGAAETMETAEVAASAIGQAADQTRKVIRQLRYNLDRRDLPLLRHVIDRNDDYRTYDRRDKEVVVRAASIAFTIKNVIGARLLGGDGTATEAIRETLEKVRTFLKRLGARR